MRYVLQLVRIILIPEIKVASAKKLAAMGVKENLSRTVDFLKNKRIFQTIESAVIKSCVLLLVFLGFYFHLEIPVKVEG